MIALREPIEITVELDAAAEPILEELAEHGVTAEAIGGMCKLCFPPDPAILARFLELLRAPDRALPLPEHILPIRISSSRAVSLGFRSVPAIASVFVTNARVDTARSALIPENGGPVVAIAAEHGRILESLSPPLASKVDLEGARRGLPAIRWPRLGLFARGVRMARCPQHLAPLPGATGAREKCERWIEELDRAWKGRVRSVALIGWPVYPARDDHQPALDAAEGNLLPPTAPFFTRTHGGDVR
jgi:hypothetical protein